MNKFKKGGFQHGGGGGSGGRPQFGGNKFGGGRSGGDRRGGRIELFPAVCAECKKNCEVPFRPTGDKPVYCRDCFGKQRQIPGRNSNGADGPRPDFQKTAMPQREQQPEYAKPQNNDGINALKRQLDSLESKVNRVLELMSKKSEAPALVAPIVKVAPEVAKTIKAKAPVRKAAKKAKR